MTTLEQLQPSAAVRGVLPDCAVAIVYVQWLGSEAVQLIYKSPRSRLRGDELRLVDDWFKTVRACRS